MKIVCSIFYFKASQNNNTIYFFIMPSFSSNYSLNSSSETLKCCTQLLLRYFSPSFKDFNMNQTLKSIGLRSLDEGGHNSFFIEGMKRSTVLFEVEIFSFEVLFHITQVRGHRCTHLCWLWHPVSNKFNYRTIKYNATNVLLRRTYILT